MSNKLPWVDKHKPTSLDQFAFQTEGRREKFQSMIDEQDIPQLLLSGTQGTGKSSLAFYLVNNLGLEETDILTINASRENKVEVIRNKIFDFIQSFPFGPFKVVHLEEADYITPDGQGSLRRMMDEYSDVARFVMTCNYEHKIIPALVSRMHHYRFKSLDKTDVTEIAAKILVSEGVQFDLETVDKYVAIAHPDLRKIINMLEQNTQDQQLLPPEEGGSESGDYKLQVIDLLEKDKWGEIRNLLCNNVSNEEWEDVYRFLYENIYRSERFASQQKWEEAIVIIAEHLYKHTIVADPEINAAAMFIRLTQL